MKQRRLRAITLQESIDSLKAPKLFSILGSPILFRRLYNISQESLILQIIIEK